jgi:hypothetical protein
MARRMSEGRSAAKARWEADKCSLHFSYRLKGKAGTMRPIPMTSVKSLAARFYRLKSGHAPTGVYLKRFGHREDDKCWWCKGTVAQTGEHLFRHCSWWGDQQSALWKAVGKAKGWKSVIKRWWTSWRLLKSGSSRPNEWRDGAGTEADSRAYIFSFLFFSVLVFLLAFICQLG